MPPRPKQSSEDRLAARSLLISEAARKGYTVSGDDAGLWWVHQPARPRRPAITLGSYSSSERAWLAAALFATSFPEARKQ